MPNSYFQFKQFRIDQERSGMKVTTDACLFGALIADHIRRSENKPNRVLDIGTGTGLLALMTAQVTEDTQIDGVDMNKHAHFEALNNFNGSSWKKRLTSTHTYIQKFRSSSIYDLIVCNPPFFGKNLKGKHSHKNQAMHNDHLSMEELSESIHRLLSEDGIAWILYPEWEMKAFTKWIEKKGLFPISEVSIKNKENTPTFRMARKFSRITGEVEKIEVIIRKKDGSYSEEFSYLLKDYYL